MAGFIVCAMRFNGFTRQRGALAALLLCAGLAGYLASLLPLPRQALGQAADANTATGGRRADRSFGFDARDFGVKADGATDDLASLNAAIAAVNAAGGGVLQLPAGTVVLGPSLSEKFVVARSNVTLRLTPATRLKVKDDAGNFEALISTPSTGSGIGVTPLVNFALEGGTIDMNPAGNAASLPVVGRRETSQFAIKFNIARGVRVRNVRFDACTGINTVVVNGPTCTDVEVKDCSFHFLPLGASPAGYDNSAVYVEGYNFTVAGNRFSAAVGSGARAAIELHGAGGSCVGNNSDGFLTLVNVVPWSATTLGQADAAAHLSTSHVVAGNVADRCARGISIWPMEIRVATARGGGASTLTLDEDASAADNAYNGLDVYIVSGAGAGQRRTVSMYAGATRVLTVSKAWDKVPDGSSVFNVHHVCRNVTVAGNTINVAQVSHQASSCGGIQVVWGNTSRGAVEGLTVTGNTITFEDEAAGAGAAAGARAVEHEYLEAGIMLTPWGNECIGATVVGNTIIRAPGPGIRPCGTAPGSRMRASRIANNVIIDAGQHSGFRNRAYRAALFVDPQTTDCVIENNSIHDTGTPAPRGVHAIYSSGGNINLLLRNNVVSEGQSKSRLLNAGLDSAGITADDGCEDVPYAPAYAPAPMANGLTKRMKLAGPLTVAAPLNTPDGKMLRFIFTQDAAGRRAVTWNAVFKQNWRPDTGANRTNTITFEKQGRNWVQVAASTGLN
jgi:hypothetical protein